MKRSTAIRLLPFSLLLTGCHKTHTKAPLKAGFSRVCITPPIGIAMTGFGERDIDPAGCKGVHDDLFVRALWLEQGDETALIMGFDLLFFSREEADRFRGAIGRKIDIPVSRIVLNTSHTHTGPKVGSWFYTPSDPIYLAFLENAIVGAALNARDAARPVTVAAGTGATKLPVSRRKKLADGTIEFAPDLTKTVCNTLPVCRLSDAGGKPVCLLFSVACHPSTVKGVDRSYLISADFPGAAMRMIDERLGAPVSLFLQGAGGDTKARIIAGEDGQWRAGTWDDVDAAGKMVADEVFALMDKGLGAVDPDLKTAETGMAWKLEKPLDRAGYEEIAAHPKAHSESLPEIMRLWALEQIAKLDKGMKLPDTADVTAHGVRIGDSCRIVGIEGELVGELGNLIIRQYDGGVTFPLGYTDGTQMYLPASSMLDEGGYEVESFWEYHQPARQAKGNEEVLAAAVGELKTRGIR